MKKYLIIISILGAISNIYASQTWEEECESGIYKSCGELGMFAYFDSSNSKYVNKTKILQLLKKGCEGKDSQSCQYLAYFYEKGMGTEKNSQKQIKSLEIGCNTDKGVSSDCCYNLGTIYANKKNYQQAFKYYKLAINNKNQLSAYFNLGLYYYSGKGTKKNYQEALKYYKYAADKGAIDAQINLASMYSHGKGVKRNYKESVKYLQKASEQGSAMAQDNLAIKYYYGDGVKQDKIKTYQLLMKAAKQGYVLSQKHLDVICKESPWACKE